MDGMATRRAAGSARARRALVVVCAAGVLATAGFPAEEEQRLLDFAEVSSDWFYELDRDRIRRWYNGYNWRGTAVYNPFDFFLEPDAEHFPFEYDSQLTHDLTPYLAKGKKTSLFSKLLNSISDEKVRTIDYLVHINLSWADKPQSLN